MEPAMVVEKSFDSQLLPDGEPTSEWGLDQLGVYAQLQYRQIMDGEKTLTAAYWRLGHGLVLTKKIFKHGHWGQHLRDLRIDKTRASKATAIYRTFAKEEEAARYRVDEAYAQRERKKVKKQTEETGSNIAMMKDAKVLRKSISNIAKKTGVAVHDAAFTDPNEAVILIPAVRKAISELQELLRFLEERAEAGPRKKKPVDTSTQQMAIAPAALASQTNQDQPAPISATLTAPLAKFLKTRKKASTA